MTEALSAATEDQLISLLHAAVLEGARAQRYGLIFEDALRVSIVDVLLSRGATLQVPSTRGTDGATVMVNGEGFLVTPIPNVQPKEKAVKGKRGRKKGNRSPDIRVVQPVPMRVELKARGEFGSNDQHASGKLIKDLDDAAKGRCVAIFAADLSGYDAWRGVKASRKGTKAKFTFEDVFPLSASLSEEASTHDGVWNGQDVTVLGSKIPSPWPNRSRVVIAVSRTKGDDRQAPTPPPAAPPGVPAPASTLLS